MTKMKISLHKEKANPLAYEYLRKEALEEALSGLPEVELKDLPKDQTDYTYYFDGELFVINKEISRENVADLLNFTEHDLPKAILDVTHIELFDNPELSFKLSLCCICASIVTCPSAIAQEVIYEHTGRLARIVETPIRENVFKPADLDTEKDTTDPLILWIGNMEEIFSIRKDQKTNYPDLNIEALVLENSSQKMVERKVEQADIIYLPKTNTELGEQSRVEKVLYALLEGKFVVAPDLIDQQDLAFDGNLKKAIAYFRKRNITEWIEEKQNILRERSSLEQTQQQLQAVIKAIPEEEELELGDVISEYLEFNATKRKTE